MAYSHNLLNVTDIKSANDLFNFTVKELQIGVKKSKHPFHLVSLCSIKDQIPYARTVVSRGIDEELQSVRIHSDVRAEKISQITANNNVALLYYSSEQKLQVRLHGMADIVTAPGELMNYFNSSSLHSKLCYAFPVSPGQTLDEKTKEAQFSEINESNFQTYESSAKDHFSVIKIKIFSADILWLCRSGHIRIQGDRNNGNWEFDFVVA